MSRCVLTDTYSPTAMEIAPAATPATPAVKIGARSMVAAATPTTMPAVDTMPSLAPRTPARNQLSLAPALALCGSAECAAFLSVTAHLSNSELSCSARQYILSSRLLLWRFPSMIVLPASTHRNYRG